MGDGTLDDLAKVFQIVSGIVLALFAVMAYLVQRGRYLRDTESTLNVLARDYGASRQQIWPADAPPNERGSILFRFRLENESPNTIASKNCDYSQQILIEDEILNVKGELKKVTTLTCVIDDYHSLFRDSE